MKKIHRILGLILCLAEIFLLAACGTSNTAYSRQVEKNEEENASVAEKAPLTIGYSAIAAGESAPWAGVLWDTLENLCKENGWNFTGKTAAGVPTTQSDQVADLIKAEPDYIILFPGDITMADNWVKDIHNAGIPVITICIDTSESALKYVSAYVGPDQEALASQLVTDMIRAEGASAGLGVACISGFQEQQDYKLREQGLEKTLRYFSNYTLLATEYAGASREEAKAITKTLLENYGDKLNVLFCMDDEFAMGAIDALSEAGRDDILIYSITGSEEAIEAVSSGEIAELAKIDPEEIANETLTVINGLENGIIPDHFCYTSRTYITAENAAEYAGAGAY